jgi:hypothetical protein
MGKLTVTSGHDTEQGVYMRLGKIVAKGIAEDVLPEESLPQPEAVEAPTPEPVVARHPVAVEAQAGPSAER